MAVAAPHAAIPRAQRVFKPSSAPFCPGPSAETERMVPGSRPRLGLEGFSFVKFCRNLVSVCKFGGFFFFLKRIIMVIFNSI